MGMVNKAHIKSNQELNRWLLLGNLTDEEYNFKVINRLKQLNKPECYGDPCFNCGSNHTIYDNLRVTERDVDNLDKLINEYHGFLTLKDINVTNNTDYHDKRNFYCLVYYGLATRTDEMQEDGNFKQTYKVTELGKQFASGSLAIPAYYAQRDNEIIDRSNNYLIYRDEVFENKFCMQNVLDCNRRVGVRYIPFDERQEGDYNYISYSTSYAVKHGKELVLNKLKEQGHITEKEIMEIMFNNFKKTNSRDIIYGLLTDGVYLGYVKQTETFWLLKEIIRNDINKIVSFNEIGNNIKEEMDKSNIKKKSFDLVSIEQKSKNIYAYNKIYKEKLFTLFNANINV